MTYQISWSFSFRIAGGPTKSGTGSLSAEAFDSISISIPAAVNDQQVEIQPGGENQVQAIVIAASRYHSDLTYKVNAAGNPAIRLDQPHVFAGEGLNVLLDPAVSNLFFSNNTAEDIRVEVLVCRDATP